MRLAAFGDSIAAGLGARGRSYPVVVAERLRMDLVDLTGSARQVTDSALIVERAAAADVVLVAHGITEALLRPTPQVLARVPARWREAGWMDPRPYYSSRRSRRWVERAESATRWRLKVALMRGWGAQRFCPPERYALELERLLARLPQASRVVVVTGANVDERYFPGSSASLRHYAELGRAVALRNGAEHVDVATAVRRWEDYLVDHFHPNTEGHRRIAERVVAALTA